MVITESENSEKFRKTKEKISEALKLLGIDYVPDYFIKDFLEVSKIPQEELERDVELDREKMKTLSKEILSHFKCRMCGKCCRLPNVEISDVEIEKICDKLKIDEFEFSKRYLANKTYLKKPCPFLENRKGGKTFCRIHDVRPNVCQQFPFSTLDNTLQMVEECPLSKEIYEGIIEFEKGIPMDKLTKEEEDLIQFKRNIIDKAISLKYPKNEREKEAHLSKSMMVSIPILEGFVKYLKDGLKS